MTVGELGLGVAEGVRLTPVQAVLSLLASFNFALFFFRSWLGKQAFTRLPLEGFRGSSNADCE